MELSHYLHTSEKAIAAMRDHDLSQAMTRAISESVTALKAGKPLLICGNGGSASDAEHIAGELVGRFKRERRGYNVLSLVSNSAVMTAWSNDYDYESVFQRQVEAHGAPGGVLMGISTSGNSRNVVRAAEAARAKDMLVISLTGRGGGALATLSDALLDVPVKDTALVQQCHICLYHYFCEAVETALADTENK